MKYAFSFFLGLMVAILPLPVVAAENVHLSIDASKPGARIDRNLFGQFAENLGHGLYEGIWVGPDSSIPNTRGIRNDVVAALRELKVPNVRWPGGCFADQYHWRKGIGPRDKRPATVNSAWGDVIDTNAFGTDEFMDFIQQIGSTPYVSVNLGSGTPQEAAEWLEYMTAAAPTTLAKERAANGHPEPYKVGFLGIGNESWDCGGAMTPDYYVSQMKIYSRFVRNYESRAARQGPDAEDRRRSRHAGHRVDRSRDEGLEEAHVELGHQRPLAALVHGSQRLAAVNEFEKFGLDDYAKTLKSTLFMDEFLRKQEAVMDKYDPEKKVR